MEMFLTVGGIALLLTILNACAASPEKQFGQDGSGELFPSSEDDSWGRNSASTLGGSDDSDPVYSANSWQSDDFISNPANGYPMIGGMGGCDIEGNAFGFDSSYDYSASSFDDSLSSSFDSCSSHDFGGCGGFSEW
jgi:hypothetical protein